MQTLPHSLKFSRGLGARKRGGKKAAKEQRVACHTSALWLAFSLRMQNKLSNISDEDDGDIKEANDKLTKTVKEAALEAVRKALVNDGRKLTKAV